MSMMTRKLLIAISLIFCFFIGALFCAYLNGWLILCLPVHTAQHGASEVEAMTHNRKKILVFWWHDNSWQSESTEIVWPADYSDALETIAHTWLATLDEEKHHQKNSTLQTAMLSPLNKVAYLSFDKNPLDAQWSMYEKLRWIDGLSRTIGAAQIPCTHIQLFANHKPLLDTHLDFSQPWPLSGFIDQ